MQLYQDKLRLIYKNPEKEKKWRQFNCIISYNLSLLTDQLYLYRRKERKD